MSMNRPWELHGRVPLSDRDLVAAFEQGEVGGHEVMKRLLGKIGLAHRAEEFLVRQNGKPFTGDNGKPLLVVDYLSVAGKHPAAIPAILNFVRLDENDRRFPIAQDAMADMVNGYLPKVK